MDASVLLGGIRQNSSPRSQNLTLKKGYLEGEI